MRVDQTTVPFPRGSACVYCDKTIDREPTVWVPMASTFAGHEVQPAHRYHLGENDAMRALVRELAEELRIHVVLKHGDSHAGGYEECARCLLDRELLDRATKAVG